MNNWYHLETKDVLARLKTDPAQGLLQDEAQSRLAEYGPNELIERGLKSPWLILWEQLTAVMVVILIIAAAISAVLGDYKDAADFCAACLIDLNAPNEEKIKSKCKLPIREPGGVLNRNAIHAAAASLAGARGGVQAPPEAKRKAARRLLSLYREMDEEPPESLRRLAE